MDHVERFETALSNKSNNNNEERVKRAVSKRWSNKDQVHDQGGKKRNQSHGGHTWLVFNPLPKDGGPSKNSLPTATGALKVRDLGRDSCVQEANERIGGGVTR